MRFNFFSCSGLFFSHFPDHHDVAWEMHFFTFRETKDISQQFEDSITKGISPKVEQDEGDPRGQ